MLFVIYFSILFVTDCRQYFSLVSYYRSYFYYLTSVFSSKRYYCWSNRLSLPIFSCAFPARIKRKIIRRRYKRSRRKIADRMNRRKNGVASRTISIRRTWSNEQRPPLILALLHESRSDTPRPSSSTVLIMRRLCWSRCKTVNIRSVCHVSKIHRIRLNIIKFLYTSDLFNIYILNGYIDFNNTLNK